MIRAHERPTPGAWYLDLAHKVEFEIVATDNKEGLIEIQYFGGEIEEMEMDDWYALPVVSIAAPTDWSGPYEVDKEVFTDLEDDKAQHLDYWNNPLNQIEE